MYRQTVGWALFALLLSSSVLDTLSYPNQQFSPQEGGFYPVHNPQLQPQREERKFAEKPNALKKVALDDLDDIQTNQLTESTGGGFSWSNLLGMVMQMIFNPGGINQGPNKSEGLDDGPIATSPWANLISVGLKILTAILGGGAANNDGIDKVDNGGSPMQGILAAVLGAVVGGRNPEQVNMLAKQAGEFISIIVNLLDALKTSFSHRSLAARNIGKKDTVSDATVAGIAMAKGYMRSLSTDNSKCMQKFMCQANNECTTDIGQTSLYCHLGSYAASFILERTTSSSFDVLYEAGRRGRSGDNCQQAYLECNEV
ncbi:uncharacterized protein LOC108911227 isoform X1 [Anoplophora glabripennis]|uniref:uncharacterized protein LOC108911227 isoform X1 n=1 Tax=Anoplophora glabripennis TaxID=217634 RepID=UPI000875156B|nr:uncharacterized protein LOC108911227 isoform X1 [Anoplophora glabripennis]